jgi:hypothetical protein
VRRLTAAAGIAAALLALTACRSNPSVAAYVGDQTFTEDTVTSLVNGAAKDAKGADGLAAPSRENVVQTLVMRKVCKDLQAAKGFTDANVKVEEVAQAERLPAASEFAKIRTEMYACRFGIPAGQDPLTQPELQDIYQSGVALGAIDPTVSFEQISPEIAADPRAVSAVSARKALEEQAAKTGVSVNPRYRSLVFGTLQAEQGPLVWASFGQPASTAVTDAVTKSPTAVAPAS